MENIENKLNFSASFYGYAKFKKYKMSHHIYEEKSKDISDSMKEIKNLREGKEKEVNIQGILEAPDISKEDFILLLKTKDEYLDDKDIQKIDRYRFRNCFKIEEELTHELIDEFNSKEKMKWYYNLTNILSCEEQTTEEKLEIIKNKIINDKWINSCYLDFTSKNMYTNHLYTLTIIEKCGYDINQCITLELNQLEENMKKCIEYIDENKKEISFKLGLKLFNKKIIDIAFKEQLKLVNNIINLQYGLKIKKINKKNDRYELMDDGVWENLPKEIKIDGIKLYDKEDNILTKHYDITLLDIIDDE